MKQRERIPQNIIDKYDKQICFVVKRDESWMEAVKPRTVWIIEMGYEVDSHKLDSYAKVLLDAPPEPSEEFFGNGDTIEKVVDMQKKRKKRKKRKKFMKDASKLVKEVKENVMNISGIIASKLDPSEDKSVAHISPVATSSYSDIDQAAEFMRAVRKKRKPSPAPAPSPKKTRTQRKKQQVVRDPPSQKKKVTPKKKTKPKASNTLSPEELINEITQDGNLGNVNKFYHSFNDSDKESIEESIILYLDIYKKVL